MTSIYNPSTQPTAPTRTVTSARETNSAERKRLRPDIQGLRMLAVVAVILDHLILWPSGGFVGVDVFFVISGFLITGLLVREHERTDHISFTNFYRRRIKRIVPAATLVLIATVAAGYAWFNDARAQQTLGDAIFAFFFSANWHFAAAGTDYFQAAGPVSPLQHYWSLSVEEQFYFVWPWLMLGVLALAGLRSGFTRRRTVTGIVMGIIVVATFAFAMWETTSNPTVAYFSTFTRAWELGLGALVAIAAPWWSKIPDVARPILGWIGLIGILASYFIINDTMPFPAPWAALPVLATVLVIVAGTGGRQRFLFPLTNPVSVYVGNISYSLYLWHFPIIVFAGLLIGAGSIPFYIVTIAVTIGMSVASYHLIEMPFQKMPVLESFKSASPRKSGRKRARRSAWSSWGRTYGPTYKWGGLSVVAAVSLSLVTIGLVFPPTAPSSPDLPVLAAATGAADATATASPFGPQVTTLQDEMRSALEKSSWPTLNPTIDAAIAAPQVPEAIARCGGTTSLPIEECTWGPETATKTMVILGDSTALAYGETFKNLAESGTDWRVQVRAVFGCAFVDIPIANKVQEIVDACPARKAEAIAAVNEQHPDLVLITNTYEPRNRADTQAVVTTDEWKTGMNALVSQMAPNVGRVVLLSPPPSEKNVATCYTGVSSPADCISHVTSHYSSIAGAESEVAAGVNGVFVNSTPMFCLETYCPAFIGETPTKIDLVHITSQYADKVAPAMQETLQAAGVL